MCDQTSAQGMSPSPSFIKISATWSQGKHGTIHVGIMTTYEIAALRLAKVSLARLNEIEAVIPTEN
ncbi:MAG: hypothetical protein OEZ05_01615 [Nitrospirota bacterium]|nr:hypothetical protein [Nitrospirota bacterium]